MVCWFKKVGDILESKFRGIVVIFYYVVDLWLFIMKNVMNKLDRKEE